MTPEELLKPRYKVVALWPYCELEVGEVLEPYDYNLVDDPLFNIKSKHVVAGDGMTHYPHLFRKLEWWEDRRPEDMPEYFKIVPPEDYRLDKEVVYKLSDIGKWGWHYRDAYIFNYSKGGGTISSYVFPATQTEYETYINNLP